MEPLYIVIIGLVVLVAVYFLFIRKPEAPKQIEKAPEPKKLQDKKPTAESETPQKVADKPAKSEVKKAAVKQPADEAPEAKPKDEPKPPPKVEAAPKQDVAAAPTATETTDKPEVEAVVATPAPKVEPVAPAPKAIVAGAAPAPVAARKKDVAGLRRGLSKVRESEGFFGRLKALFVGRSEVDPEHLAHLLLSPCHLEIEAAKAAAAP